jgi:cytochrome c-type biogenesis protein CcmH
MMRSLAALTALFILLAAPVPAARAVTPDEMLKDPVLEARARAISQLLRCVVCQNQSIDDSSAPLAKDLRVLVRERLTAGDSNDKAIGFIVARYGNFVLLKPPLQPNTWLLWFGPALLLGAAAFGLMRTLKSRAAQAAAGDAAPLTTDDEERLAKLLGDRAAR